LGNFLGSITRSFSSISIPGGNEIRAPRIPKPKPVRVPRIRIPKPKPDRVRNTPMVEQTGGGDIFEGVQKENLHKTSSLSTQPSSEPHNRGAGAGGAPGLLNDMFRALGVYLRNQAIDTAFAELATRVPYGDTVWATVVIANPRTIYVQGAYLGRVPIIQAHGGEARVFWERITGININKLGK